MVSKSMLNKYVDPSGGRASQSGVLKLAASVHNFRTFPVEGGGFPSCQSVWEQIWQAQRMHTESTWSRRTCLQPLLKGLTIHNDLLPSLNLALVFGKMTEGGVWHALEFHIFHIPAWEVPGITWARNILLIQSILNCLCLFEALWLGQYDLEILEPTTLAAVGKRCYRHLPSQSQYD